MLNAYDIAYALGVAAASPIWATRKKSRAKVLTAFRERFGQIPPRQGDRPAIWIHAVSLGEVNAARALIEQLLAARNDLDVIVSTTTSTGHERATTLYKDSPRVSVVRYPLDFSAAIVRALDALRPRVVVLMELETWPNFLHHCQRRKIPVVLANGRITTHSFSRYRLIRPIVATMFRRLAAICAQDAEYAKRFEQLGAPPAKITITGTMKYDSAEVADSVAGADELQRALQLSDDQSLWVCGSTGPGEEVIALRVYRRLLTRFSNLRLAIIPRHPQRFDEVANLIVQEQFSCLRRSKPVLLLPVHGERDDAPASVESSTPSAAEEPLSLNPSPLGTGKREAQTPRSSGGIESFEKSPLPNPLAAYRERENAPAPTASTLPSETAASPIGNRQSPIGNPPPSLDTSPVLLGDTMGELRKFYALATVVFVGRSLVDLGSRQHGSDMIEPAALGKACIVGPFTGNFDQTVRALKADCAIIEVQDEGELRKSLSKLLADPPAATAMGQRAQHVVRQQQGATALHVAIILRQL